jgi:hypothetical protein
MVFLYIVVTLTFVYACVTVVFAILVQVVPPFMDDCQLRIDPVCPDSVREPLLEPLQTVIAAGLMVPATDKGLTVIVAVDENTGLHDPLATCTRYIRVAVRFK